MSINNHADIRKNLLLVCYTAPSQSLTATYVRSDTGLKQRKELVN